MVSISESQENVDTVEIFIETWWLFLSQGLWEEKTDLSNIRTLEQLAHRLEAAF